MSYLSGRVDGLGGNAVSILPNPYGVPPSDITHPSGHRCEFTGKVMSICYDRFGDFSGFLLRTEEGEERLFRAREHEIELLVRAAWAERMVITVSVDDGDLLWPVSITLRRVPHH